MSQLDIYQRADGKWAWHLQAGNGEIIATDGGQGYDHRTDCERIAKAVVVGLYAPKALDPVQPDAGYVELRCPTCDQTLIGRLGDTIEHADDGAHVHHMTYR